MHRCNHRNGWKALFLFNKMQLFNIFTSWKWKKDNFGVYLFALVNHINTVVVQNVESISHLKHMFNIWTMFFHHTNMCHICVQKFMFYVCVLWFSFMIKFPFFIWFLLCENMLCELFGLNNFILHIFIAVIEYQLEFRQLVGKTPSIAMLVFSMLHFQQRILWIHKQIQHLQLNIQIKPSIIKSNVCSTKALSKFK